MNPVDAHLDQVAVAQLTWKPSISRDIAACIVQTAASAAGTLWPDEVNFTGVPCLTEADKNCIGIAWRCLTKFGVIIPTGSFRRSTAEGANGRKVFEYRLASLALAQRWLKVNGYNSQVQPIQPELSLA